MTPERIRWTKPLATMTAVGSIGVAGLALAHTYATRSTVSRLIADHPGLHVASIAVNPFSGTLVLRGVAARGRDASVSVGAIRLATPSLWQDFVGPAAAWPATDTPAAAPPGAPAPPAATPTTTPAAPKPATADAAKVEGSTSADDIVIVSGATTYRIKRVDLTGTSLSKADLMALFDAKDTASVESRLRHLTAAAVVVPELLADQTVGGIERHMSVTHILLAGVVAGKAAAASAGEASFALKDDKAAVNGSTGAFEATTIDLAQIAHVAGSVRTDDGEAIRPVFESAAMSNLKITNVTQDSTLTIGSISGTGAKARALRSDILPSDPTKPGNARSNGFLDDVAGSFEIGLLKVTGVASRSVDKDGATVTTVDSASVSGVANRLVGQIDLSGFHLGGPDSKIDVGSVTLGTFAIPSGGTDTAPALAPPARLTVGHVAVDVVSKGDAGPGKPAQATDVKFDLARLAFTANGKPGDIPTASALSVEDLAFDVPPDDGLSLHAMGYRHLTMSASLKTRYDASSQALSVDDFSLKEPTMGAIDVNLRLLNIGQGLLSSNKAVQEASAFAILAKSIDVKLVNAGLFDKAIAYKANKDGISITQEREQGIQFFTEQMPTLANDDPKLKLIGAAVAKFIADPKTLHIGLVSKAGLGVGVMAMLGAPQAILADLDVTASAD